MKNNLSKGLIVQLVSVMVLVVLMFLSVFNNIFLPYADFVAGITFMIIAYNKKDKYSKLLLAGLFLFGIIFIAFGVFDIING